MSLCPYCETDYNEDSCEHFVFIYDRTFPFAMGDSRCPLSIQSHRFDVGALDEVDDAVEKVITAVLEEKLARESLASLPKRLASLVGAILEGDPSLEDGELDRDSYVGLRAYKDYVESCLAKSPRKLKSDYFEDNIPCASSAYSEYWSRDGSVVIDYLESTFRSDAAALEEALAPKPRKTRRRSAKA
ncbi:MAG: hypothetical protein IPF82_11140 [Blastocatellia bacterium]|nr:hypothetical protein [Blastocatellia bacterium]